MSAEDLEKYETEMELQLYREYRDVVGLFSHVVETERRFYLTNQVELNVRTADNGEVFFEVAMQDAWVWDMYRPARFVKNVRVVTFKDVNIDPTLALGPVPSSGSAPAPRPHARPRAWPRPGRAPGPIPGSGPAPGSGARPGLRGPPRAPGLAECDVQQHLTGPLPHSSHCQRGAAGHPSRRY